MSDEILKQLGSADVEMKRHENDILVYEQLLQQWKENFPQSLGDISTISPKMLAETLKKQTQEIFDLQRELDRVKDLHVSDVQYIMNSTDAQLQAARVSLIAERKQQNQAHSSQNEYYESLMKNKERQFSKSMEELAKFYENQLIELKQFYDNNIKDIKDQLDIVQRREHETKLKHKSAMEKMHSINEHQIQELKHRLTQSENLVEKLMAEDDDQDESNISREGPSGQRIKKLKKEDLIQVSSNEWNIYFCLIVYL